MKLFSADGRHAAAARENKLDRFVAWANRPCAFEMNDFVRCGLVIVWGLAVAVGVFLTAKCQNETLVEPLETSIVSPVPVEEDVEVVYVDQTEALAMGIDAVISSEVKGEWVSDTTMIMVGNVIMNRTNDSRYPDTVDQVLMQPYQFSCFNATGMIWVGRAANDTEFRSRCMAAAEAVMNGERMLNYGVVYVSGSQQGTVEAQLDGLYFCR
jgi:hypothetical protein